MTPKEKAQDLVSQFKNILMDEDTDCGQELLCTSIAIKNALVMINELLSNSTFLLSSGEIYYWDEVRRELNNL